MRASSVRFESFYRAYLAKHTHPLNRALHLLAKLLALGALGVAVSSSSVLALLFVPVLFVAPCWLGHLLFERNRPASWDDPRVSILGTLTRWPRRGDSGSPGRWYYSVLADFRMCADMLGLSGVRATSDRA